MSDEPLVACKNCRHFYVTVSPPAGARRQVCRVTASQTYFDPVAGEWRSVWADVRDVNKDGRCPKYEVKESKTPRRSLWRRVAGLFGAGERR